MRRRAAVRRGVATGVVALVLALPVAAQEATSETPAAPPLQLAAVLHAHSRASSGNESVAELARRAHASGVDVVLLAENFGYEFRYAPWPLRYFFEARVRTPTLETYGIERYLDEIRQAQRDTPEVLLLPGVETPPYYYWTGSLLAGDLVLHDMQRNVLVVAPAGDDATATAALWRGLPAVGNRHLRAYGARSLALLVPGLLLVGLALRRLRQRPLEPRRPGAVIALLALLSGTGLLWLNFPYAAPLLEPYDATAGNAPVQQLFDYVRQHGGLSFWSLPEAVDSHQRGVGPFSVSLSTPPYSSVLSETSDYTGFGGVYADTVTTWRPGGIWDATLLDFQARKRDSPPWLVGESAYHYAGQAGKQLDDILTVLLVEDRTPAAVLAALAGGHTYSLRRQPGSADLRLRELALIESASRAGQDQNLARVGETLLLTGAAGTFEIVIEVEDGAWGGAPTAGDGNARVTVEVVRDGALLRRIEGVTPLYERWTETLPAGRQASYYRVIVYAERPAYLVSNPVFVRRPEATR